MLIQMKRQNEVKKERERKGGKNKNKKKKKKKRRKKQEKKKKKLLCGTRRSSITVRPRWQTIVVSLCRHNARLFI